jgi:hypothetical protein
MYSSLSAVFSTDSSISPCLPPSLGKTVGKPDIIAKITYDLKIQEKKEFTGFIMPSVLPVS